jgi:RNA polymerase sigma factor (TIGR02999 family)
MKPQKPEVTELLKESARGDRAALDELLPLVYGELRRIADRYLRRERADHTLQPTALVHEAYLRLVDQREVQWQNRAHFFGVAAQMMRRILVDHARAQQTAKRGSGGLKVSLDDVLEISDEQMDSMIALDDALQALEKLDPQKSRIVEMRFFGGLSIEETAEALGLGTATVIRQWRMAKAFLYKEVSREN